MSEESSSDGDRELHEDATPEQLSYVETLDAYRAKQKELKNKRRRELYTLRKEAISKRRRELRIEKKQLNEATRPREYRSRRIVQMEDGCSNSRIDDNDVAFQQDYEPNQTCNENEGTCYIPFEVLVVKDLDQNLVAHVVPSKPHILKPPMICSYCGAKKFERESQTFCCGDGTIKLCLNVMPNDLFHLFTSDLPECLEFRRLCRSYNNHFAFTSLGVRYDKDLCKLNKGVYTFKVQGQVYHYINNLIPDDEKPSYLQLYFYDTENELENRLHRSDKFCTSMIETLINILHINPYSRFFRSLGSFDSLDTCKITIKCDPALDQRVYNEPTVSQVAAVWVDDNLAPDNGSRDIFVYAKSGTSHKIQYYYGCYDPLQYPLLFPRGEPGWRKGIQKVDKQQCNVSFYTPEHEIDIRNATSVDQILESEARAHSRKKKRLQVSCREYYCYKFQIRNSGNSCLLHAGRLLQQFVVDMYVKIETARLDYFRNNQKKIRAELYQGIVDSVEMGESSGQRVGRKIILPSSFTFGPRDCAKRYMDAMALVQRFGKPDIFLTMTCNPNWKEIQDELKYVDESHNRPDLLARIFRAKLEELKDDLFKKEIFGPVAAYIYVIEFQKRGLPHAHFLIILKQRFKIITPEQVDKIVCCEIPNENKYPYLRSRVLKHMMHGPCGNLNPKNVCMVNNQSCKYKYPRDFIISTSLGNNSYPLYRRRDNGEKVLVRGKFLDNRWVVPYNPFLLAKYDCHINVEICSTVKAVKYLYKYVYKGHDRINFSINYSSNNDGENDEISRYQSARWVSPPEAMWRIYEFTLAENIPSVVRLQLHLEDHQLVTFRESDNLSEVISNDFMQRTMLTEFFRMNVVNEKARTLLYREFPMHFVWDKTARIWLPRKQKNVIGRIVSANPSEGERYYLRLLLNHIRGPTSFQDLKTVNGLQVQTFREAAFLHGLLNADSNCESCIADAVVYQMPGPLRRLFATILIFCAPNNPKLLWSKFKTHMFEDYVQQGYPTAIAEMKALCCINSILEPIGKNINDYKLVPFKVGVDENETLANLIEEETRPYFTNTNNLPMSMLNREQQYAYDVILDKVFTNSPGIFFIDGPGGTGKTYLYKALLMAVRSKQLIALATASSGVAASLLPGGRTAHSRFKIPLDVDSNTICPVSKQSALASLLRLTKLIIWDEAPMVSRYAIEALDKMLRDITECDLPFGGKVVVLGGDFRQILPVVPYGDKVDIMKASLVASDLWPLFTRLSLVQNMRAQLDVNFSKFLLNIGNGTEQIHSCSMVMLPSQITIPFDDEADSLQRLIDHVFPNMEDYVEKLDLMINRVILAPKNEYVDHINSILLEKLPGESFRYFSYDEAIDKSEQGIQEDFLNTLTPNGIPPHELILKVNCPVMLLRNINPSEGLCNGTRLICKRFERNVIDAEIAIGEYRGKRVFLPRIPFIPLESDKGSIPFKRTQFPIRPCFAMTINKAQGQTLDFVGLYLPDHVFSHGQLYVALSRARRSSDIKVLIKPTNADLYEIGHPNCTKNIVYQEVLELVHS